MRHRYCSQPIKKQIHRIPQNRNQYFKQKKMQLSSSSLTNHTNRFFQLKFAQQKHSEIECNLVERLHGLRIQLRTLAIMNYCSARMEDKGGLDGIQESIERMNRFCSQLREKGSIALLQKQSSLEQQAQRRDITRQYEQRIFQLDCTVYTKEVDISVDHVGKLAEEKPTLARVRELGRWKTQIGNLGAFLRRKGELVRGLRVLGGGGREKVERECYAKTETAIGDPFEKKTDSAITKQSSSSDSNPEISQNRYRKRKKMLILSSQSKFYEKPTISSDPQLVKMGHLLRAQKIKEDKLRKEYERLWERFGALCMENRELSAEYLRVTGKNKGKVEGNQSKDDDN